MVTDANIPSSITASLKPKFQIQNYDSLADRRQHEFLRNGPHIPSDIRCLLLGASGTGKTNFLLNLLLSPHGLNFSFLILCGNTTTQDKYSFLIRVIKGIVPFFICTKPSDFPKRLPDKSTVIFDDVDRDFFPIMQKLCTRGRHQEINVFILCQSFASCVKHGIRDQTNFLIVFKQDGLNLKYIWRDNCSEIPFKNFAQMAYQAWIQPFVPFIIDKTKLGTGRFRISLDQPFVL